MIFFLSRGVLASEEPCPVWVGVSALLGCEALVRNA